MLKKSLLFILCLFCSLFIPVAGAAAETDMGTIGITLISQDHMEDYRKTNPNDGDGIFVYVQNIDTSEMFRFPLSKANGYSGRFDVAYGNYRVIKNPDASSSQYTIGCDTVFTVGKSNPDISIQCFIEAPEDIASAANGNKADPSNIPSATPASSQPPAENDTGFHLNFQNILTIIVFIIMAGIWVYHRFIKYRA